MYRSRVNILFLGNAYISGSRIAGQYLPIDLHAPAGTRACLSFTIDSNSPAYKVYIDLLIDCHALDY